MATSLFPIWRYAITDNGVPVPGAKLYTFLSGTSTPEPVYQDADLTVPHTNPVVADAAGVFPTMFMGLVAYRMMVTDANDVTLYPAQDDITDFGSLLFPPDGDGLLVNDGSGGLSWTQSPVMESPVVTDQLILTGGQIAFPVSQIPSSDPNVLDDYEEGDWTPILGGSTSEIDQIYASQHGEYVKIGRWVFCTCTITLAVKGTITGTAVIKGFPYAVDPSADSALVFGDLDNLAMPVNWSAAIIGASGYAQLREQAGSGMSFGNIGEDVVGNTTALEAIFFYRAAD